MTPDLFLEQIETERLWREQEIRSMNNILINLESEEDRNKLRRAIVCLLYAHVEGFVKYSFSLYIDAINSLNLSCNEVRPILVAAVYYKDFHKLTDPDAKSRLFTKEGQEDKHIRRLCLHEEFFQKISGFLSSKIRVEDGYINTESNVGREVLEKLLYQVGLPHKLLSNSIGPLSQLKNKRNGISHGTDKSSVNEDVYQEFYNCTFAIIDDLSKKLFDAFNTKSFLLTPARSDEGLHL
ncbi:TPA: MAE_28990/MAE_18760 family HEPN-like nuclease [Providencia rettgeri]